MKPFFYAGTEIVMSTFLVLASGLACREIGEPARQPNVESSVQPIELKHENDYMRVQDRTWLAEALDHSDADAIKRISRARTTLASGAVDSYMAKRTSTQDPGPECNRNSDCAGGICHKVYYECVNLAYHDVSPYK
jgi:hypothetical protein